MTKERINELYRNNAISYEEYLDLLTQADVNPNDSIVDDLLANFDIISRDETMTDLDLCADIMQKYNMVWGTGGLDSAGEIEVRVPSKEEIKDQLKKHIEHLIECLKSEPDQYGYSITTGRYRISAYVDDDRYDIERNNIEIPEGHHNYVFKVEFIPCSAETSLTHII